MDRYIIVYDNIHDECITAKHKDGGWAKYSDAQAELAKKDDEITDLQEQVKIACNLNTRLTAEVERLKGEKDMYKNACIMMYKNACIMNGVCFAPTKEEEGK